MTSPQTILTGQLSITWSLATRYYFPALTEEIAQWAPSVNVCGLVQRDGQTFAQWPDEEATPLPDSTVGWLLWHIEWWWADAIAGVAGRPSSDPLASPWSGSVVASVTLITQLHATWTALLTETDLDHMCAGPWPTPQPFSTIAG